MVQCVHHLFEKQVQKSPQKPAIECLRDGTRLSYAGLNQRANQYAHYFLSRGIGPKALVGVFLRNTLERIITLLAIHKAGASYVLLDPDHPREYLSTILRGTCCALFVTEEPFLAQLPLQQGPVMCLDTLTDVLILQNMDNPEIISSPENEAYVAFTSGSTGRPKGVVISHLASVNHICAVAEAYALGDADRILLTASPGFDMTVEDILSSLAGGATIVLLPHVVLSSENISFLIEHERLTVLNIPGSLWQRWVGFLRETHAAIPHALRLLVVGSEAIHTASLAQWKTLPGAEHVVWIAAYGTSETAVTATLYRHAFSMPLPSTQTVPIGRPIPNVEAWVLDESLRVCAPGVPGNLFIGGICLAQGYLNDPEETARKFRWIQLPGRPIPTRLFDTGDRALRLPDETLCWISRSDEQLKWHGFRIEPAEIEHLLLQHPAIREAVVVVQPDPKGENHLVAYLVPSAAGLPSASSLHEFLAQFVPVSHIPSRFRPCETLPLSPSGKINRRALSETPW